MCSKAPTGVGVMMQMLHGCVQLIAHSVSSGLSPLAQANTGIFMSICWLQDQFKSPFLQLNNPHYYRLVKPTDDVDIHMGL